MAAGASFLRRGGLCKKSGGLEPVEAVARASSLQRGGLCKKSGGLEPAEVSARANSLCKKRILIAIKNLMFYYKNSSYDMPSFFENHMKMTEVE